MSALAAGKLTATWSICKADLQNEALLNQHRRQPTFVSEFA